MPSPVSVSQFCSDLEGFLEHILKNKKSLEIEYKGRRLIVSPAGHEDKLSKLIPHPDCIKGDPEDIVRMDWSREWNNDLP